MGVAGASGVSLELESVDDAIFWSVDEFAVVSDVPEPEPEPESEPAPEPTPDCVPAPAPAPAPAVDPPAP
ncbi:hypothetical protein C8J56DRAFT_212364 [Mycena floridula]|nr:hypothetical protein C8J56DRAFT_212364 [Mycena floridula]